MDKRKDATISGNASSSADRILIEHGQHGQLGSGLPGAICVGSKKIQKIRKETKIMAALTISKEEEKRLKDLVF